MLLSQPIQRPKAAVPALILPARPPHPATPSNIAWLQFRLSPGRKLIPQTGIEHRMQRMLVHAQLCCC